MQEVNHQVLATKLLQKIQKISFSAILWYSPTCIMTHFAPQEFIELLFERIDGGRGMQEKTGAPAKDAYS
ncbi:MAG: hypothetical protein CL912_26360 [Deltaproteobacteria bacterium]|nr:hypothetical protein [Deltaproteobacteria bacterium]|tara:strand:- start:1030 stop:1239 length:210 start_codon:yes stop_codon:yes gene_type:complete